MVITILIIACVAISLVFSVIGATAVARRRLTVAAVVAGTALALLHALYVAFLGRGIHAAYLLRPSQDNWLNWFRLFLCDAPELLLIGQLPRHYANWRVDFWTTAGVLGVVGTIHQFLAGVGLISLIQWRLSRNHKEAANNELQPTK